MKPLIGVTGYYIDHSEIGKEGLRGLPGQDMAIFSYDYIRSLQRAGATVVLLPIEEVDQIESTLNQLDGLLLAGGADINPIYYGDTPKSYIGTVEEERDNFELNLAKQALEKDIPILGICRGLQVLNVAAGGSLYQDLEQEMGPEYFHVREQFRKWQGSHSVDLLEEGKIYEAIGQKSLMVNSFHHQAVKTLGKDFEASAWSFDGVIEAIESKAHRYVAAVQWHPEMMSERDVLQQRLFNQFVNEISKKVVKS
ncbi:gamma-glutamyl-gamma-aminobutyrate hydrolase family protein [Bacillus dicomae]|uniref:Gamma-glutamyl-gamma-aminobutyrate hydrolase family protein n=1 Tax=Bacillus dicomae TaxID=3088378 RepID=A0AC61T916_9BACI|nr:gamma-glutamyl-gamma-aminobutyrate hydrolase family protein [Bacillus dicomae]TPV45879.1 gamma-glutamyl-gamma-aminobutyrate hydrolase family protein [Bacillus dicomae]